MLKRNKRTRRSKRPHRSSGYMPKSVTLKESFAGSDATVKVVYGVPLTLCTNAGSYIGMFGVDGFFSSAGRSVFGTIGGIFSYSQDSF